MSQKSSDQVGSLKEEHQKELAKVKEEVDTLKASLEAKTKEVNDKNTTLLQARQLKILRIIKILAWRLKHLTFPQSSKSLTILALVGLYCPSSLHCFLSLVQVDYFYSNIPSS